MRHPHTTCREASGPLPAELQITWDLSDVTTVGMHQQKRTSLRPKLYVRTSFMFNSTSCNGCLGIFGGMYLQSHLMRSSLHFRNSRTQKRITHRRGCWSNFLKSPPRANAANVFNYSPVPRAVPHQSHSFAAPSLGTFSQR